MNNLPLPCLLYYITTFAFVTPAPPEYSAYKTRQIHKIKSNKVSLIQIENSGYLLNIDFKSFLSDKGFILTKQRLVSDDNVLTLDEYGRLDKSSPDTDLGVFTDTDTSTSVTISYNKKTDKYSIEGIVDNTWIISPLEIWSPPAKCDKCLPVMLHTITRVERETVGHDYKLVPEDTVYEDPVESLPQMARGAFIASAQSSSYTKYPEVLIAVDYSLHKNLGKNEARTKQYVEKHFNAVNAMYAKLSEPKIKLVLAGVIIGTSAASLPFLHKYGSYSQQFEADDALSSMGQHYAKSDFPRHDLVMALTAQDMQIRGSSGVIGYAYVGGACASTRQVTIVEDKGTYNGVGTAAHEIGHLLGVVHDGDYGHETCRAGDYIMSPWSNGAKQWSDCSVKQMRDFVTSRKARCLNNKPKGTSDKPVTYRPVNNKPVTYRPVNNKPVTFKPVNNKPVTYRPVNNIPVTYRPVNNIPVTFKPVNNKPSGGDIDRVWFPDSDKPSVGGDNDRIVFPDDPDLPFRPDFLQTINHVVLDVFKFKEKVLNDFFSKLNTAPSK